MTEYREEEPSKIRSRASRVRLGAVSTTAARESTVTQDSLGDYMRKAGQITWLTAEDEVVLAKRVEAGMLAHQMLRLRQGEDSEKLGIEHEDIAGLQITDEELEQLSREGIEAKQQFAAANLRLVIRIAKQYTKSGVELPELVSMGNPGMIHAIEKFDYTKGFKFSTYATNWIKQSIRRGIMQERDTIRLPVHKAEQLQGIRNSRKTLTADLGRDPTHEEIAAVCGMSVTELHKLESLSKVVASLDEPLEPDGDTVLGDVRASEASGVYNNARARSAAIAEAIGGLFDGLDERSARVITMRYGLDGKPPMKLAEIGREMSLTSERIRQIEGQAKRFLSRYAQTLGVDASILE